MSTKPEPESGDESRGRGHRERAGIAVTVASIFLAATALVPPAAHTASESRIPGAAWEHVDPESAGWSPELLAKAREEFERSDYAAVLVVDHGRIVVSFGDVTQKLPVRSMRKSLLNALIGLLVDRGKLRLDATLAQLGIDDDEPPLSEAEKSERRAPAGDALLLQQLGLQRAGNDRQSRRRPLPVRTLP